MIQSILEALPFLLQAGPAIKTGLKGRDTKAQKQTAGQMQDLAGQQARLAAAQSDMNHPLFQSLYNQERQAGQADLASTIAEISRQNRKLTTMGRKPLLDQERGGESVFRNLMLGQQQVGNTARRNVFSQLNNAQNSLSGAQGAYGNVFDAYGGLADQGYANDLRKVGAYYSLGDSLKGLFGLGNGNSVNREDIIWNQ